MKRFIAAALLIALGASAAFAGPIEERKALMKDGVAPATKILTGYAKGDTPFDAAKVKEQLQVYIDAAAKAPTLFPEDSKTGGETTAAPKIWEDMAGFKAGFEKLGKDATAAQAATDTASFAVAFKEITTNCGSCHGTYRIKK